MTRGRARLITLLGVLLAVAGLAGFWLTNDISRTRLTGQQSKTVNPDDDFFVSFLVAGRDITYHVDHTEPVYGPSGQIVSWDWSGSKSTLGTLTDTILYVAFKGSDITIIAIPRDTYLPDLVMQVNGVYIRLGPEALMAEVGAILDVPIDYYAIVNLDIFQGLVDALGGVTVDVPYRMLYRDNAAGLVIDFQPGPQRMDGVQASKFIRYRETVRGDFDRIDNVKRLAYAMLARIKELNVRAALSIPSLIDTFMSEVETNATPSLVRDLATRLASLNISATATLPIADEERISGIGAVLRYNPVQVNQFMAQTFGGEARQFVEAPNVTLLVTDRSGAAGVADWYVDRLMAFGMPEDSIMVRTGLESDGSPTRLFSTLSSWEDADYFASLLNVGKQQVDRFNAFRNRNYQVELVLGADAEARTARVPPIMAMLETSTTDLP